MPHRPSLQTIARWSAITVPLMLVVIIGWATYVVIVKLALDRLLLRGERAAGIAIITLYCLLLLMTAVAYLRIFITLTVEPGLVPLGQASANETERKRKRRRGHHPHGHMKQPTGASGIRHQGGSEDLFECEDQDTAWVERQREKKLNRLEKYVPREMFVCDYDGLPLWCNECSNWKPDRTHHCSDLGRCVRRMDHFCPWVGGIVSETTLKFFLQFAFYASLFAPFVLVADAVLLARDRQRGDHVDRQLAVLLGLSSLFSLFAIGIFGNTLFLALNNLTTVEFQGCRNAIYYISVLITPSWCNRRNDEQYPFRTAVYPGAPGALYAILTTQPGENPWDVGRLRNLQSVMGESVIDWFLPFKLSPCTSHDRQDANFEFGPVVDAMKREAVGY